MPGCQADNPASVLPTAAGCFPTAGTVLLLADGGICSVLMQCPLRRSDCSASGSWVLCPVLSWKRRIDVPGPAVCGHLSLSCCLESGWGCQADVLLKPQPHVAKLLLSHPALCGKARGHLAEAGSDRNCCLLPPCSWPGTAAEQQQPCALPAGGTATAQPDPGSSTRPAAAQQHLCMRHAG